MCKGEGVVIEGISPSILVFELCVQYRFPNHHPNISVLDKNLIIFVRENK